MPPEAQASPVPMALPISSLGFLNTILGLLSPVLAETDLAGSPVPDAEVAGRVLLQTAAPDTQVQAPPSIPQIAAETELKTLSRVS